MKIVKVSLTLLAVALFTMGLTTTSFAFHSGGVAECEGCHTMHNSLEGEAMSTNGTLEQFQAGPYLLQGEYQSEACLNCHQSHGDTGPNGYHISTDASSMPTVTTAPLQRTPGGDFGWIRNDIPYYLRGNYVNHGERRGHNIVAPAFGYNADSTQTVAPGGDYPAASLACSSCHDPHGTYRRDTAGNITSPQFDGTFAANLPIKNSGSYNNSAAPTSWGAVGVYRILGGINYEPKSTTGHAFTAGPPAAVAPGTYNRTEATTQTRVAYGNGMSEWCANCHGGILMDGYTSGMAGLRHPAGNGEKLDDFIISNYNHYVKSGDLSRADTNSYNSLVPFEEGLTGHSLATYATLTVHARNDDSQLGGPSTDANVSCMSCHRAHASGFASMLRFPHEGEFMTAADSSGNPIYSDEPKYGVGLPGVMQQAALYDRPATQFAPYQRLLCNKCHAKD